MSQENGCGRDRERVFIFALILTGGLGGYSTVNSEIQKAEKDAENDRLELQIREADMRNQRALEQLDTVLQRETRLLDDRLDERLTAVDAYGKENRDSIKKLEGNDANMLQRLSRLEALAE